MVFHLDKCLGCHTCSIACKNLWTDRRGAEYMWWNNVETKPGTGYPLFYEDQKLQHGGWVKEKDRLTLRLHSRGGGLKDIFFNPRLPPLEDYYEPFTLGYGHLFDAPAGDTQPTAAPVSEITGKTLHIKAGPNWDDDYSGSPLYAANDPNLQALSSEQRESLQLLHQMVFFYLPRICNHCLNPGCLAACPAGAIYKRSEDGIVLIGQDKCRGWRMCVSGCPYKKTYYNWETGKSEKCILCYPRQETGQAPACMHACVGRIRYLGVVLYDLDRVEEVASCPQAELVEAQRALMLDPEDLSVRRQAERDGVDPQMIEAARVSPVYLFAKRWRLALPLHPEFRTLPMLFYVPPLMPVPAKTVDGLYELGPDTFSSHADSRLPLAYLGALLAGGNPEPVEAAYRKLMASRVWTRMQRVGDVKAATVQEHMRVADTSAEELEAILHLTSLATFDERFAIPSFHREEAIAVESDPFQYRGRTGIGFHKAPKGED